MQIVTQSQGSSKQFDSSMTFVKHLQYMYKVVRISQVKGFKDDQWGVTPTHNMWSN